MWDLSFENKLMNIIPEERIFRDEPMYKHTTFRIGGPAKAYVSVSSADELRELIFLCKKNTVPSYVIGNGSNILVSDKGFEGLIIEVGNNMRELELKGDSIVASAGVLLSSLAAFALKNSLTGLEFAAGIPGTVGGAMVMNAGAYGGEMKNVVSRVALLDPVTGEETWLTNEEMDFAYRHSIVREKGYIVLAAEFKLMAGNMDEIKALMDDLASKRREKQPLEYPSAGSTFKRPEGYFAGQLIQDSNLKGYRVGDAQVSEKHAGFVINLGKASASDTYQLICDVKQKVLEDSGVELEPEVILLGEY